MYIITFKRFLIWKLCIRTHFRMKLGGVLSKPPNTQNIFKHIDGYYLWFWLKGSFKGKNLYKVIMFYFLSLNTALPKVQRISLLIKAMT